MGWFLLLGGAAILLSFLAVYWLWSETRYGKAVVAVVLVFSGCVGYRAIYLPDAYYRTEFERIAHVPLPSDGEILFSNTTNSTYSSYRSCAVIEVSPETYRDLRQAIRKRQAEEIVDVPNYCLTNIERQQGFPISFTAQNWSADSEGDFSQWGLLDDGKSVAYFTMRWRNFNPV
jgi:hypothetical protein